MKIGDYVRYKTLSNQIKINKIINIVEPNDGELSMTNTILYDLDNKDVTADKYIIKSSPNIIDLIEVGDYVNGEKVTKVVLDSIECNYIELDYSYNKHSIRNKDIKLIVTKEQFSQMEYKVGDSNE